MKNWADHCSSDEESFDDNVNEVHDFPVEDEPVQVPDEPHEEEEVPEPPKKEYDWPSEPPFTAYVGNLAYSLTEPSTLSENIVKLAKEQLGTDVTVVDSRLARHRGGGGGGRDGGDQPQRHRGFGYVQFETLDQLKAVVEGLVGSKIAGRPIQLDTANQSYVGNRRQSSHSNNNRNREQVDGTKFRGGRYNNNNNRRRSSETDGPPAQRASLKLQPRSKAAGEGNSGPGGSANNIFGAGKARDEQSWRDRRKSETDAAAGDRRRNNNNNNNNRRNSARGGGGGRGRRDNNRGGHKQEDKPKDNNDNNNAASAAPAAKPVEKQAEKKQAEKPSKPAAPVNTFAALAFDSDSD